jgi:NADH:ubiquinone oxidoreductase subunit H
MGVYATMIFGSRVLSGLLLGGWRRLRAPAVVWLLARLTVAAVMALVSALPPLRTPD